MTGIASVILHLSACGEQAGWRETVVYRVSDCFRSRGVSQGQARASEGCPSPVSLGSSSRELDFFGRIRNLKDRALEQYLATEQARRSARISLVAEVANTYLTLAADSELLKLSWNTLETREATYKLIQRCYEVGVSSELDLRQAQTRVEAARVDIARYTGIVAGDEDALTLLLGVAGSGRASANGPEFGCGTEGYFPRIAFQCAPAQAGYSGG